MKEAGDSSLIIMSTDSNCLQRLSPDIWINISCYFETLKDFIRVWIAGNFTKLIPKSHPTFWKVLLKHFLASQSIPFDQAMRSSYMLPTQSEIYDFLAIQSLFTARTCTRSGCFQPYLEWSNHSRSCSYHPGNLKPGQYLSCCRAKTFRDPGCKLAYHSGMFHFMVNTKREEADQAPQQNNKVNATNQHSLPAISLETKHKQNNKPLEISKSLKLPTI